MMKQTGIKSALLALAIASPALATGGSFTNMYILGDSLSDQGNLYLAIESIFGEGNGIPTSDHYWQGRFANGENWADILSDRLAIQLAPSLTSGVNFILDPTCQIDGSNCGTNFADGGARTDYNTVELDATKPYPVEYLHQGGFLPKDLFPWTLDGQRQAFSSRAISDPGALYTVFAGANNLSDLIPMKGTCLQDPTSVFCEGRGDPQTAIPTILNGINNAITAFVYAGGRDILVPNMPNLGAIPAITRYGPGAIGLATELSTAYNTALKAMLTQLEDAYKAMELQVNIIPFDTYSFITEVVEDPEAYGFSNATKPCYDGFVTPDPNARECPDPDAYVFWDIEHPTTALHALLADRILAFIELDIMHDLSQQLDGLDISKGAKSALSDKLDGAIKILTDGNSSNDQAAVGKMQDFIYIVMAKQGKQIPEEDALSLINRAEQIVALLES